MTFHAVVLVLVTVALLREEKEEGRMERKSSCREMRGRNQSLTKERNTKEKRYMIQKATKMDKRDMSKEERIEMPRECKRVSFILRDQYFSNRREKGKM